MPNAQPIQHSFTAGELSPRMLARSDLEVFYKGVLHCANMLPVSQGPLKARGGSIFELSVEGSKGRLFGFQKAWDEAYLLVVSDDGNLYVTDEITHTIGPELVVNGNFSLGLNGWTIEQDLGTVSVVDNTLSLASVTHETRGVVYVSQLLDTAAPASQHVVTIDMPTNDGILIEARIGTTAGGAEIATFTGGGTQISGSFVPNADFYISVWKDGTTTSTKLVDTVSVKTILDAPTTQAFTHPWASHLEWIHAKMPPGADQMFFTHPHTAPQRLVSTGAGTWTFEPIPFVDPPAVWTGTSYPRALAFFQGRGWWGGPDETFYASKSAVGGANDYIDMTLGSGSAADDAMAFTMSKQGEIVWMVGLKNLLVGTRSGEHLITSEGGIIIPGDIYVEQQSTYGSNHCQPIELGTKAAYVTPDGRKVQTVGWQWTAEQWLSTDILYSSEHLTSGSHITELLWAQNPEKRIGCMLDSGETRVCLYDPAKEIIGWTRWTTVGSIVSMAKLEIQGISSFFFLVNRGHTDVSSNELLYVERSSTAAYMDAFKEEFSETPTNLITGGEHLAGDIVSVTVDGAVHPPVVIDAAGEATLQWSGTDIKYGLGYRQDVILMPRDFPAAGSTFAMVKRWNKVWLRLQRSVLPEVVSNSKLDMIELFNIDAHNKVVIDAILNDSMRAPDRYPSTPMDLRQLLVTKDIQMSTLGFNRGSLLISNDLPLPLNITGIFGEMSIDQVK